jgi:glycosyltransferase involved in cell wall biosynthesis
LLEARAVGVFTISNLGTGSEEVISHMVDGLLCGNNNQMTLEQAIKIANSERSFRESAVKKAREETEKNYDLELTYKKILEIL